MVARWHSGDEIVILFDAEEEGVGRKNGQRVESAAERGMTFYTEVGQWEVSKITIEYTVEELAEKGAKQKGRLRAETGGAANGISRLSTDHFRGITPCI